MVSAISNKPDSQVLPLVGMKSRWEKSQGGSTSQVGAAVYLSIKAMCHISRYANGQRLAGER